ncbi:MAG TPA: SRPBCC domain-containing protein [Steroidobacteraceae bacterium]|jgi:activator of HSP90 ATPase
MQTVLKSATVPVQINAEPGGTFVLFGGHIVGRNLELIPNVRIVQAWREATWKPGVYSVATFELSDDAKGTRISFDHVGFPKGGGAHLAKGWYEKLLGAAQEISGALGEWRGRSPRPSL